MYRLLFPLLLLTGACIDVPELDRAVPDWVEKADYPDLIPLNGLGTVTPPAESAQKLEGELDARQARLRRKASALRSPVIDPETRKRLTGGVR